MSERQHKHRREDYHQLLRAIRHNVGDPRPPMVTASALYTTAVSNGRIADGHAESAMRAAVANGHVQKWTDADGLVRYGLTADGIAMLEHDDAPLGPDDVDTLRAWLAVEVERESPNTDFVGWVNRRLAAIDS